jgi:uncharacterized protein YbjT (DUF2867 family)
MISLPCLRYPITRLPCHSRSSILYTSVREGIYADAFPLFLSWYPTSCSVVLPVGVDGPIALASRDELGEATAALMLQNPPTRFQDNIALLTGPRAYTLTDVVQAVSEATGIEIKISNVEREDFTRTAAELDKGDGRGGKPEAFFKARLTMLEAVAKGDAATVDPLMGELLGRIPRDGMEVVRCLVESAGPGGYTWHQNYLK